MSKPGLGLPGRRRHSRISFLPRVASEVVDSHHGSASSSSSSNTTPGNPNARGGSGSHSGGSDKDTYRLVIMGASKVGKTAIIKRFLYDAFPNEHNPTVEELHKSEYEIKGIGTVAVEILDTSGTFSFPAMRRLAINSGSAFILVYAINDKESFEEVTQLREMISKAKGPSSSSSPVPPPSTTVNNSTESNSTVNQISKNNDTNNVNCDSNNSQSTVNSSTINQTCNNNNNNNSNDQSSSSGDTLVEPVQVPIVIAGNKIDLTESRVISKEMVEFECIDWEVGFVECSAKNNDNINSIFQQLLLQAHLKGSLKIIAGPSSHYHQHSNHHNPWSLLTNHNHNNSSKNNKDNNHWNHNSANNHHSGIISFSSISSAASSTGESTQLNELKKSDSHSRRRSSLPVTDLFNYSMSLSGLKNNRSAPRKKRKSCTPS